MIHIKNTDIKPFGKWKGQMKNNDKNTNPYLTQSEKNEIKKEIETGKYQFQDLQNRLDNLKGTIEALKTEIKEISLGSKAREVYDVENRTKTINIESKLNYFESELKQIHEYFVKLDMKLEALTELKTENKKNIAILSEKIKDLEKLNDNLANQTNNLEKNYDKCILSSELDKIQSDFNREVDKCISVSSNAKWVGLTAISLTLILLTILAEHILFAK